MGDYYILIKHASDGDLSRATRLFLPAVFALASISSYFFFFIGDQPVTAKISDGHDQTRVRRVYHASGVNSLSRMIFRRVFRVATRRMPSSVKALARCDSTGKRPSRFYTSLVTYITGLSGR